MKEGKHREFYFYLDIFQMAVQDNKREDRPLESDYLAKEVGSRSQKTSEKKGVQTEREPKYLCTNTLLSKFYVYRVRFQETQQKTVSWRVKK